MEAQIRSLALNSLHSSLAAMNSACERTDWGEVKILANRIRQAAEMLIRYPVESVNSKVD